MAHLAKLAGLTDELITIITSTSPRNNSVKFNRLKESSQRALRHHNHARTNQFDVISQLDGLVEKFCVHDKEPLADALSERLLSLSNLETRWEPEILQLLLELSERPVAKSRLEDLDFLKEPEPDPGPPLRWAELVAEDPLLRDKHIWRNVDFAAESADEDEFEDSHSELSETTSAESSIDGNLFNRPESYEIPLVSKDGLRDLRKAQFWLRGPSVGGVKLETVKKPVIELQAIREILFMLSGFPTSLFEPSSGNVKILEPSKSYTLKSVSYDAFYSLAKSFANQGTALMVLRVWVKQPQSIRLLQVFQSTVLRRLLGFDESISALQQRFVAPEEDVVVSLLDVRTQVETSIGPLLRLSSIIQKLDGEPYAHSFRYLELLYDETCKSQMAGEQKLYTFFGTIFFECFRLYLSPLRSWMEEGELNSEDKMFFVSESSTKSGTALIWESRYRLRQSQNGSLHAPDFLHAMASKIFTTGKSVVVLKRLHRFSMLEATRNSEPILSFDVICGGTEKLLAPFSELFHLAFEDWTQSKHHQASSTLRRILFDSYGLQEALGAISTIYFMSEGAAAAVFTNSIFDKLDTLDDSWSDRFTLTELAQSTFGSRRPVMSDHLRVKLLSLPRKIREVTQCRRSVKVLSAIEMSYQLTWPIQMIVKADTISAYQRIFTFLFQIRRSTHILSRHRLIKDMPNHTSNSDERALYYSLRTRLLWFNQTLYYYLTEVVLDARFQKLRQQMEGAEDVDSMIRAHAAFIKLSADQALLGGRLELIQKTILKILDIGIRLEDAQTANAVASKQALEEQQEMMDRSMASLGLHTPQRKSHGSKTTNRAFRRKLEPESESDDEAEDIDVDMSILSSALDRKDGDLAFVDQLREMRADFDRLARFVATGLKGVARAGGGEEAKSWDLLGEMLESGLGAGVPRY